MDVSSNDRGRTGLGPTPAVRGAALRLLGLSATVAVALALALGSHGSGAVGQRDSASLPSPIIYPPQRIALRMNHAHPAHLRLRCERCHQGATDSERAGDRLIPEEASCAPCHDAELDRSQARSDTCGLCHVGSDGTHVVASVWPSPRLRFSHQQHARLGVRCLDCHSDIQRRQTATASDLPTMEQCWECHGTAGLGGDQASGECSTCHLTEPDGRLRTAFGHGAERTELLPPRWLHGLDHDRDFMVRHRWVAADQGELCAACHTERECVACHDGRVRPTSIHPSDFLTHHGPMARRNEPRCASCHTTQRFCTECHARLGLSPMAAPAFAAGARFHPPPFTATHGIEARRSMTTCTSCHAERDCVVCHGARGVGTGISPHPPGYAERCRSDLQRNPRACVTCHGDAIDARCR